MKYAIEIIPTGKRDKFVLKRLTKHGTIPVNGIAYPTENAAMIAAGIIGIEISACGEYYEIVGL